MHFSCSTYRLYDTIIGRLRNEPPEGSCIHTLSLIVRKQAGLSCSLQSRSEKCNWDPNCKWGRQSIYRLYDTIIGRLRNEPPEGSCIHTLSLIVRKQAGLSCSLQSRSEKCNWDPNCNWGRQSIYTFLFYLGTSHLSILEAAVNLLTPNIWLLILPSNFPHFLVNQLCESSVRSRQQLLPDKLEFSRFHVNPF